MTDKEYLLICLMEECAEVQQIASKCLRFGMDNHHPETKVVNINALNEELNDLAAITDLLLNNGKISKKCDKVKKYMENFNNF